MRKLLTLPFGSETKLPPDEVSTRVFSPEQAFASVVNKPENYELFTIMPLKHTCNVQALKAYLQG